MSMLTNHTHRPVNGGGPSMAGQQWGVVDDGAVLWVVYHLHRDELRAEWQYVEFSFNSLILCHNLVNGFALYPPAWKLEHCHAIFLCFSTWGIPHSTHFSSCMSLKSLFHCRSTLSFNFTVTSHWLIPAILKMVHFHLYSLSAALTHFTTCSVTCRSAANPPCHAAS